MQLSVVCPFYNEELILDEAIGDLIGSISRSDVDWELILVNDGSEDQSISIAQNWACRDKRIKIISYEINQGRGYALKSGIEKATGDIIVTTEIDLSWGVNIIEDILKKFLEKPGLDIVIASPHLNGGGYSKVPLHRIWLSKIGNLIIRYFFTHKVTMNTGMTRGYKRNVIQNLIVDEKGKEFHLEVLLKLITLGYKIQEIPAVIEWKDYKHARSGLGKRKSSSKINKLIVSHLNFAVFANPIRYFWAFSAICFLASIIFMGIGIYRILANQVAVFIILIGLFLALFGLIFFGFGIVTIQNIKILKEMWRKNSHKDQL